MSLAAVCTTMGLPVAWQVETARQSESPLVPTLLDKLTDNGFAVGTAVLDKGYDVNPVYEACEARGIRPIIPLRKTPFFVDGQLRRFRRQARGIEVALPDWVSASTASVDRSNMSSAPSSTNGRCCPCGCAFCPRCGCTSI